MQSIRNFFHTDRWWGKTVFIIVIYTLFWCVFYGLWFLIPREYFNKNTNESGIVFLLLNIVIIPAISFFIPYYIKKLFQINKVFLYILHVFFILLSLVLFFGLGLIIAFQHFQIG